MNLRNTKGQISLFILIALSIFLVLIIGNIVYTEFILDDSKDEFIESTIPQTPLQSYVQQCIAAQTRDAIERIGDQGGYIDTPFEFRHNPLLTISPHPSRDYVIPYWVNKNKITIPTIEQMEIEMGDFISRTLVFCLDDFASLGQASSIEIIQDPKAKVSINKDDVVVDVSFTVSKTSQGLTRSFERFVYKEPVSLRETLAIAREFAISISESTFLEDMTVDLMSISDPLIPMSNIQFRCDPKIWVKNNVQKNLEKILYYNVPSIRVKGGELTDFEAPESVYAELEKIKVDDFANGLPYDAKDIPSDTYQHAHMYYDSGQGRDINNNNLKIAARYLPEYGMEFAVRPSTDGKLYGSTGEGTGQYLKYLCVQVYHFTYDVSYPIEFIFREEDAFQDGSPFILRFATSVNIDHNLPDKGPLTISRVNQLGDYQPVTEQLCEKGDGPVARIFASDPSTTLDISGVKVNYICHKYVCPLGNTSLQNGRALLQTQLPTACYGAKLQFEKDDYIGSEIYVNNNVEIEQQTYQVDLTRLETLNYKVVLGQNQNSIIPTELKASQHAVLLLDDQNTDFNTYATFDDQVRPILKLPNYGTTYNMTLLVYEEEVLIGGYIGELPVSLAQLRQDLTLHAFEFIPRPRGDEEFAEAWTYLTKNEVYRTYYAPRWS